MKTCAHCNSSGPVIQLGKLPVHVRPPDDDGTCWYCGYHAVAVAVVAAYVPCIYGYCEKCAEWDAEAVVVKTEEDVLAARVHFALVKAA